MKLSDFDYTLPPEFIAQHPVEPRDAARLLVVDRSSGRFEHRVFRDLPEYLRPADVLAVNDTRVIPARLRARKSTGGSVEVLLLRPARDGAASGQGEVWEALLRPGGRVRIGKRPGVAPHLTREGIARQSEGGPLVRFANERPGLEVARGIGRMPV